MARFKKAFKYSIICTVFLMFYLMLIAQNSIKNTSDNRKNLEDGIILNSNLMRIKNDAKLERLDKLSLTKKLNSSSEISKKKKYIFDVESAERINRLFDILYAKEKHIEPTLRSLNLLVFEDLIQNKYDSLPISFKAFSHELDNYLQIVNNKVQITEKFVKYLSDLSDNHSFNNPRTEVNKEKIIDEKDMPTIVTAANANYYDALQATVYQIHKFLPDYRLIIYDLGLTEEQNKITLENCKCEVRKFDTDHKYADISNHVTDLHTYAWKPLLIQEALRDHETVIYIDSSIRFQSSDMKPIINTLKNVGMLTQFIGLKLTCYTNPKMFTWFGEETKSYEDFFTVEANILLFHQNFLTSLIMKSWITCALYEQCIAPTGSSISGCCGCHRFDQDAITIVNSFFYGHPIDYKNYLPAYSFTTQESYFFQVKRYEGKNYFTKKN